MSDVGYYCQCRRKNYQHATVYDDADQIHNNGFTKADTKGGSRRTGIDVEDWRGDIVWLVGLIQISSSMCAVQRRRWPDMST